MKRHLYEILDNYQSKRCFKQGAREVQIQPSAFESEIHPNDLITLLPGTIIQFRERTEKVCLCFAGFSAHCAGRINLMKNIGNAYPKLIEQPVVPLNEEVASYLKDYFALLSRASCNENFEMDSELDRKSTRLNSSHAT